MAAAASEEDGGSLGDREFYLTLASDELQVEVLPAPELGRKRSRVEAGLGAEGAEGGAASAAVVAAARRPGQDEVVESDEDDDKVEVLLCDEGATAGSMDYYLGQRWNYPALTDGSAPDAMSGAIVPLGAAGAGALARRVDEQGEPIDEEVDSVLSKIEFHMDFAEMADTPWRQFGANLQDHFNFGVDERAWKDYLLRQVRIRLEAARHHCRRESQDRRTL
mmetsp:Transcript_124678/g.399432  ORF Transcript_124678/g.399432 Transcript_124678/m.399432 type:complete len:221 (-) Transcript_124678:106-768(-)